MAVYAVGDVRAREVARSAIKLDLVPGLVAVRPVRQNFVRVAPAPFVIAARPRGVRVNFSGGVSPVGGVDSGAEVEGGNGFPCEFFGGDHLQLAQSVGAGVTTVIASRAISRPFVVRYVSFYSSSADPTLAQVLIKIANDNDTTGGTGTSGTPLDTVGFGTVDFSGVGVKQESYPNKIWTSTPAFFKVVLFNGTVAAVVFQLVIDIEYMS